MPGFKVDWKSREIFSKLHVPPDLPVVIRVDGWNFHDVSERARLNRPFDKRLIKSLVMASVRVIRSGLPVVFAFSFSDEISYVLEPPLPWGGRVEKLVSVLASLTSSTVSRWLGTLTSFDGRVVVLKREEISDYLNWRQMEAWRNALNSYALLALEAEGYRGRDAAEKLRGMKAPELHDLIFKTLKVNVAKVPAWQRRGVVVRRKRYLKRVNEGVVRRKITVDWSPPLFSTEEGRRYVLEALEKDKR